MPTRSLSDADPELVQRYDLLAEDFALEHPGQRLQVICVYRTPEEQRKVFASGNSQLLLGNHNLVDDMGHPCSRAVDVMVVVNGKATWKTPYYVPLIDLAARHGLVSGGTWKTLKDYSHLELPHDGSNVT